MQDNTTQNSGKPVKIPRDSSGPHPLTRGLALVFCCFVASFLGAWLFVTSGLVKLDASTISDNKEKIVLQESEVVADVAKKVSPSVVSIVVDGEEQGFFGTIPSEGAGTGIVISKDGYVLTNSHVVSENATKVKIIMSDDTTYTDVRIIGRDPLNDIAFLKINGVQDLTPAQLGDSSAVNVGQKVVAIGNALGQYQTSVTSGIISAVGRPLTASSGSGDGSQENLENLFQTDAAINPGNSGGPLVNIRGQVIGINTAVAASAEGIGFAIPINDAQGLIKSVIKNGRVTRAYLGVRYVTITPSIADEEKLPVKQGAYLKASNDSAIVANSPASKAGLKEGDIVTAVDGKKLDARNPLASLLSLHTVGDTVELTVLRGGKEQMIKVTLEAYKS